MVSFLILKIFSKTLKGNTLIVNSVILFLLQKVIFLSSAQCKKILGERELIYTITESLHDITNSFRRTHSGASLEIYFRNISCSFVGFQTFVVLVSMNVSFFSFSSSQMRCGSDHCVTKFHFLWFILSNFFVWILSESYRCTERGIKLANPCFSGEIQQKTLHVIHVTDVEFK